MNSTNQISVKKTLQYHLASLLLLPGVCFGEKLSKDNLSGVRRNRQLEISFQQFKELTPASDPDKLEFQKFRLENPVSFEGKDYYGFRFTVPQRANHEDLVWAFLEPNSSSGYSGWYILPEPEKASAEAIADGKEQGFEGFKDFMRFSKTQYPELHGLPPTGGKWVVLQHLSGASLQDGRQYLIWFGFKQKAPNRMSLKFTFASLTDQEAHNRKVMEKVLGLHRGNPNADSSNSSE